MLLIAEMYDFSMISRPKLAMRWYETGKFWQLMLAERALQSACGPERSIKVFAEQDDINLEYCDREDADKDCNLLFDGRPVRHVRLDARVAVVSDIKRREVALKKSVPMKKKFHEEQAPWFL